MTADRCITCGLCKESCPVYKVVLKETVSPRGLIIITKKDLIDDVYHYCSLCKACEVVCPTKVEVVQEMIKQREKLRKQKEPRAYQMLIKNIREYGNPYGRLEEGRKPEFIY